MVTSKRLSSSGTDRGEINEDWKEKWRQGTTRWHMQNVNPHLIEFFSLFGNNVKNKRILVPLCGKTADLRWLYEQGMSVVGIDLAELPVQDFFVENNLYYTVEQLPLEPQMKIYSHDDRLRIFLGDLFQLNPMSLGGSFDFVWDRAALTAIIPEDQQKYWFHINSLLTKNTQGLLECIEYNPLERSGPPYTINEDSLHKILGDTFSSKQLCRRSNDELPAEYGVRYDEDTFRVMYYLTKPEN